MRTLWKSSLALSLGFLGARAEGVAAPPVAVAVASAVPPGRPALAAQLERPIACAASTPPPPSPAAALDRPVIARAGGLPPDGPVRAASFSPLPDSLAPVVRGQAPEVIAARPMPVGPSEPSADPSGALHGWSRGDGVVASTRPSAAPLPAPAGPGALPPGTVVSGPPLSGPPLGASPPYSMFAADGCGCAGPAPVGGLDCPTGPTGPACAACDCGAHCGGCCPPGNRFYVSAEYLLWWLKGDPVPPLVTSGAVSDPTAGILGSPSTQVLFGGNSINTGPASGARGFVGYWFTEEHCLGIEAGGFFLGPQTTNFTASSFGNPVLARPFINAITGAEDAQLVARSGVIAGSASVGSRTTLWGAEANLRTNCWCGPNGYVDLLLGYRQLGLNESLDVTENLLVPAGTTFLINDHFATHNRFYGAQIGAAAEYRIGRWVFDLNTKVGMGPTQQIVDISGSTVTTPPPGGGPQTVATGGLLALTSNIGRHVRDQFTVVPEVGFNIGYLVTPRLRCFVGYNFLYWSSVARPGQAIDRTVNPNLLPPAVAGGPARPAFNFNSSDFWAQGVTFGIEFRY